MPNSPNKVTTLRPDLQTFVEFDLEMQRRNYIGLQILPRFDVPRQSGTFGKIKLKSLLSAGKEKLERAARSGFSRADWDFTEDSFATKPRGVEEIVDDRESDLYKDFFEIEQIAALRAYDRLFSGYERRVIDATITGAPAGRTTSAGTAWDDFAGSDPRADVKAAGKKIWDRTGMWPNTLVISRLTFRDLQDNAEIIKRMAGLGAGQSSMPSDVTTQRLAELFDVDNVLVANAISLATGGTVESLFPADKALLMRCATNNDMQQPCFGRTMVYTGDVGDFDSPVPETYREENIKGDVIRIEHESQEKILYPEMAEVIDGLTT